MGYLAAWRTPYAPTLLLTGLIARLGIGITPLALLLLVEDATGRYAAAGLAVGVYAVAGVIANPPIARLADRIGAAPVLRWTSIIHALVLIALALSAEAGLPLILAVSALAGATYPPLSGAIRDAWAALTRAGHPVRQAALAAETSTFELVHVIGPLILAGLALFTAGYGAVLLVAAGVTALGGVAVAQVPVMSVPGPPARRRPVCRAPGFGTLLACAGLLGAAFGAVTVGVPAFADGFGGGAGLGGLLLGVWSLGSVAGGAWFGTRRVASDLTRQYGLLLAANGVAFLALAAMPGPWTLGLALVVGGAFMAPALTGENNLVARIAPGNALTEAYTWILTVTVLCDAAGSAGAGMLVDWAGEPRWAFVLGGGLSAIAGLVAVLPRGALAGADRLATVRLSAAADVARTLPALRSARVRPERQMVGDPVAVAAVDRTGELDDPTLFVAGGSLEEQRGGVERHAQQP